MASRIYGGRVGLNREAMELVGGATTKEPYAEYREPHCGQRFPLFRYRMAGGRMFREVLWGEPRSTEFGPRFFMVLKDADGAVIEDSRWSEEAVNAAAGISGLTIKA